MFGWGDTLAVGAEVAVVDLGLAGVEGVLEPEEGVPAHVREVPARGASLDSGRFEPPAAQGKMGADGQAGRDRPSFCAPPSIKVT